MVNQSMFDKRVLTLKKHSTKGPIIYWMSREQRVNDNWSLLFAQELSTQLNEPFRVVFCLAPDDNNATKNQYNFMLNGLKQVQKNLSKYNISFEILIGEPFVTLPAYAQKIKASGIVTDFDPLRIKKSWQNQVLKKTNIGFYIVDAHNIVPVWEASNKKEFSARTLRPKIYSKISEYLTLFPKLQKQKLKFDNLIDWNKIYSYLNIDATKIKTLFPSGEKEALKELDNFIENKLSLYSEFKNDPNKDVLSNMSIYLHFGQISSQTIALAVQKSNEKNIEVYLEELIIRKELAENYCHYSPDYDSINAFPEWAKQTLEEHKNDIREFIYSLEDFEKASTHDLLWNAAQLQMLNTGKMHGFMRMYWAKKILEWTTSAKDALYIANYLNDKYSLDGKDPNGYVGTAWSIGGVHDRAWFQRPIFGKIRYMNYNGCKRKFDVKLYISKNLKK